MPKDIGKSWERFGRRFILRLSLKKPEEVAVMNEYDRRSELLGKEDKEFLKACLIAGYKVLANKGIAIDPIALSTNESNNTQKEQAASTSPNESHAEKVTVVAAVTPVHSAAMPATDEPPVASSNEGSGVAAKRILGGLMKHG